MVLPVDKVLDDLRHAPDYTTFSRIRRYITDHSGEYSLQDAGILEENAEEQLEKRFNVRECSQIRNVEWRTESSEWMPLGMDYSISLCADALDRGMPFSDFLLMLFPDMASFKVDIAHPSAYERELARSILTTPEERRSRKLAISEVAPSHGEISAAINVADLLERQRLEMQELIDAARQENHVEMERLRESINSLKSRMESSVPSPEPSAVKTISRVLDSAQYAYFQHNVLSLNLPVSQRRIARGEYEVSVRASTLDDEQKALAFLADVEDHAAVKVSGGKIRPAGYDQVIDALCDNYAKSAHVPCGLSRTGALSTLAERLIEYAINHGTEWDKMFDMGSIDLFAKRGQIYTREQADEAFNAAVRAFENRGIAARMQEAQEEECSPESLIDAMLDYDAIGFMETQRMLSSIPPALATVRNSAMIALQRCGYYPNNLDTVRDEGEMMYANMGTSYNEQVTAKAEQYAGRYGVSG